MSLSKFRAVLFLVFLFSCFLVAKAEALAGASFSLSPSSGVCIPGGTFDLDIVLTTDDPTSGATAIINYDPSLLEAQALSNGEVFPLVLIDDIDADLGIVRFDAYVDFQDPKDFSGSGVLATVTFAVLDVGETSLSFDFEGEGVTTDSNVAHTDTYQEILTSVSGGSYTFEEDNADASLDPSCVPGGETTPTPTPTTAPGGDDGYTNPAPTPTTIPANGGNGEAPGGGILEPTVFLSLLSILMIGVGLIL